MKDLSCNFLCNCSFAKSFNCLPHLLHLYGPSSSWSFTDALLGLVYRVRRSSLRCGLLNMDEASLAVLIWWAGSESWHGPARAGVVVTEDLIVMMVSSGSVLILGVATVGTFLFHTSSVLELSNWEKSRCSPPDEASFRCASSLSSTSVLQIETTSSMRGFGSIGESWLWALSSVCWSSGSSGSTGEPYPHAGNSVGETSSGGT